MGWVSTFLSKAVMAGFVLGFSIGIIIDQSHKLFGVAIDTGSYVQELWGTIEALPDTSGTTLAVGAGSLALLLLMRYLLPKLAARADRDGARDRRRRPCSISPSHGVAVTGDVPTGLFSVGLPDVGWSETAALLVGALSVIFVGYSESLAVARAMARQARLRDRPQPGADRAGHGVRRRRAWSAASSSTAACRRPPSRTRPGNEPRWHRSSTPSSSC